MTQSGQHDHSPKNLVQVRIKELAEGLMLNRIAFCGQEEWLVK